MHDINPDPRSVYAGRGSFFFLLKLESQLVRSAQLIRIMSGQTFHLYQEH